MEIKMGLRTDRSLMYLIQETTKLPSADILGFYSDLATRITQMGIENMAKTKTKGIRKVIDDYFPGTPIPFKMVIDGRVYKQHKYDQNGRYIGTEDLPSFNANCEISFPKGTDYVGQDKLSEIIAEKMLLGGSDLPPFERPATKTPKLYKELMAEIQTKRMV